MIEEEAKKRIYKIITTKYNNDYSIDSVDKEAIETILNELDKTIPIEKIEKKIKEMEKNIDYLKDEYEPEIIKEVDKIEFAIKRIKELLNKEEKQ